MLGDHDDCKDNEENEERMKELELTPDMYCYNFIQLIVNTDSEDNNQIFQMDLVAKTIFSFMMQFILCVLLIQEI
jgi:hypothetical protein